MAITDKLDLSKPRRKSTLKIKVSKEDVKKPEETSRAEEVKNQLDSSGQAPAHTSESPSASDNQGGEDRLDPKGIKVA